MKKLIFLLLALKIYSVSSQCSVSLTPKEAYCGYCSSNITSTATGVAPFTYSWSSGETTPDISGKCSGGFTLTVRDHNNCVAIRIASLSLRYPAFTYTAYAPSCSSCCDGNATLLFSSPYPPYTYSYSCTAQTGSLVTGLCGTPCHVTVVDNYGCGIGTTLDFIQPVGLAKFELEKEWTISPNPFSSETKINFSSHEKNTDLVIFNAFGEVVQSFSDIPESITFSKGDLKSGIYFFRLKKDNTLSGAKKVVITE